MIVIFLFFVVLVELYFVFFVVLVLVKFVVFLHPLVFWRSVLVQLGPLRSSFLLALFLVLAVQSERQHGLFGLFDAFVDLLLQSVVQYHFVGPLRHLILDESLHSALQVGMHV